MTIKYCLKTLKLCIIILNISYILGLLWLILTEIIQFYTHFDYQQQLLNFQEEKFDIEIPDEDAEGIQTVANAIKYIEDNA